MNTIVLVLMSIGVASTLVIYAKYKILRDQNEMLRQKIKDAQIFTKNSALNDDELDEILEHDLKSKSEG